MARAKKTKGKSGKVSLDFKGVETRVLLPENDYKLKPTAMSAEDDSIKMSFEIMSGKFKGKTATEYFSTKPTALWRFANFIVACGLEVPDGEAELDFSDFEDVEGVMGVCTHEEYEGKTKMRWDFYPVDEDDGDADDGDDEDDKKAAKDKKSSKSKKIEKVSKDEVDGAGDEDELQEIIDRTGIDCDLDDFKGIKKQRAAVLEALEEADLLEGDEPDEKETKGKDKKSGKDKKVEKVDGDSVDGMDEDELQELIDEHELDVDLDDHKTLRKKVRAVKDALEEKDLLEE